MNNRQIAKIKVIRTSHTTLSDKNEVWKDLPAMVKTVASLGLIKDALAADAETQATPTQGATLAQEASRAALTRLTRRTGRLLAGYAADKGDVELERTSRADLRTLKQGSLVEVLAEARRVEKLGLAHAEAFVGSTPDPQLVGTLTKAISAYEKVMGKPRLVVVTRATATSELGKNLGRAEMLLKKIDGMVEALEDQAPEFATAWKHSRKGRAPQPAQPEDTLDAAAPATASSPTETTPKAA